MNGFFLHRGLPLSALNKKGEKIMENRNYYAYVRVSSTDQNEERQILAMQERNVPKKKYLCG